MNVYESVSTGTIVDMLTLNPPERLDLIPDRQCMSLHCVITPFLLPHYIS